MKKFGTSLIKKNELFKQLINNRTLQRDYDRLQCIHSNLVESNRSSKEKFHLCLSAKLSSPSTPSKTHQSILKTFDNGWKTPLIPPIIVNGKLVTYFLEKGNIFNDFFSHQCQPSSNDSILPSIPTYTNNRVNDLSFNYEKILKVVQSLDPNKPIGHDGVSPRMLKPVFSSIIKPFLIIFRNHLKLELFQTIGKGWHYSSIQERVSNLSVITILYLCYLYVFQSFWKVCIWCYFLICDRK